MKTKKFYIILSIIAIILASLILCRLKFNNREENISKENKSNEKEIEIICNESIKRGEEIAVKVKIKGNEVGILGIQGTINYDKEIFEASNKNIKKDGWMISALNEETGMFMLEITDEEFFNKESYIYDSEEIVEFIFKTKENSKTGKTNIEISDVKIVDANYETTEIKSNASKEVEIKN